MFVDLDRFKPINDSLGHAVGDLLLKEVAQRLVNQLRVGDTICRIGGDEFVVVLPEVKRSSDAAHVAQKVIEQLSLPVVVEERELSVSCSIGIAVFPDDGSDAETADPQRRRGDVPRQGARPRQLPVLHRADEPGRVAPPGAREGPAPRAPQERAARALPAHRRCADAGLAAHEALVRWQHPERGHAGAVAQRRSVGEPSRSTPVPWPARRAASRTTSSISLVRVIDLPLWSTLTLESDAL